ncbi:MAG: radical SAM protein [Rhodospirillaceae bacterium]|nr:radical SAM protein [Rhodospirillaceae bacterium]
MSIKIMIATTPIRPVPTNFPPIGSLGIIKHLKTHGHKDVEFYHIDANRPAYDDVISHIVEAAPDIIGISAVVSTAYAYTKQLSLDIKRLLPNTLVVIGGSLAASAELLLRRTGIDICVTGEGERTFLKIVERCETTRNPADFADIPGLALIDVNGFVINTGYEEQLPAEKVYDFDWEDLEAATDMSIYVSPVFDGDEPESVFREDPRTYEPARRDKNMMMIPAAKGCVAKCTFCHRFMKGIRYIPVQRVVDNVRYVMDRYNVGFVDFCDENFGTDKRWLRGFCAEIKKLDILWRVAGMRVNCVDPDLISLMKDAGCSAIQYGMETGSATMLEVMEKKVKIGDNYNAVKWTIEAGLRTVVQLVVGMPGETSETIAETTAFAKFANTQSPSQCPTELSINYAQALPGTPLYEFGRRHGLIGRGLDGEEDYLLRISDKNAHDEQNTLNFTTHPKLVCETWRLWIQLETNQAYVEKFGLDHYKDVLLRYSQHFERRKDTGYYANPKRLVDRSETTDTINEVKQAIVLDDGDRYPGLWRLVSSWQIGLATICYPTLFYRLRHFLLVLVILRNLRYSGAAGTWKMCREYMIWRFNRHVRSRLKTGPRSLRKIVNDWTPDKADTEAMLPLRRGR